MAGGNGREEPEGRSEVSESLVPRSVPWGIPEAMLVLAAAQLVPMAFTLLCVREGAGREAYLMPALLGGAAIICVICILALLWSTSKATAFRALGFRAPSLRELARAWKVLAVGTAAYFAVAVAAFVVMDLFRFEWRLQEVVDLVRTTESVWALVLAGLLAVVIAPFVEEMVFRSVLYLPLRSRLGVVPAALIVSAAFAAVHGYARGTAQLAVLSLIFIALFERTGTLWAPIVAHGLYNGLTIVVIRLILPKG